MVLMIIDQCMQHVVNGARQLALGTFYRKTFFLRKSILLQNRNKDLHFSRRRTSSKRSPWHVIQQIHP